jgi:hypothetical protein
MLKLLCSSPNALSSPVERVVSGVLRWILLESRGGCWIVFADCGVLFYTLYFLKLQTKVNKV